MSSKQKKNNQNLKKNTATDSKSADQSKKITAIPKVDLLDNFDNFFTKKSKLFYIIALGLTILLAGLLFDVKVGPGGDDSAYVQRAYQFIHSFVFPSYQGPMYPFVLSPFILIFGIKLILLKGLSLVFLVVSLIFFYKAFNKRIPGFILSSTLLLVSINYFVLYFASQTYSETFFMMLQSIFFWYFASRILDQKSEKLLLSQYVMLGFILFLMTITKSIAFAAVIAIGGFFIISRRWKDFLYTTGSFISFYGAFEILKRLLWGNTNLQFASQGSGLMYKDFYKPSQGKEDLAGFIHRFFDNSNQYFSKHLFEFLGLRNEYVTEIKPFLTILIYAVLVTALLYSFRKNKLLFFVGVYVLAMCGVEFLVIQAHWDQWRLIIIFYPLILMLIFAAIYFLFKQPKMKSLQFLIPLSAIIIFFMSFSVTSSHVKLQRPILERNLKGNLLYGLTPDWINYIQMSKWAARNIPKDQKIASRKPDISFIYSERIFNGITTVPTIQPDSFLAHIKPDTSVFIAVKLQNMEESKQMLERMLYNKIYAVVSGEFSFGTKDVDKGNIVCIYRLSKTEFEIWSKRISDENIYFETNLDPWLKGIQEKKNDFSIVSPDELLLNLKKNNIRYIVLGSIRTNPYQKTGDIINTIHRYLYYIQLKYPTILKEVHKIGTDEVASLVEVDLK